MGFIADLKALSDFQKIKSGKRAKLSISQITGLIINLPDANRNLDASKYNQIFSLFTDLRKCNTKMEMTYQEYLLYAVDIIKKFDAIAPYEKYCGGNEIEFSFLMDEIRKKEDQPKNDDHYNEAEIEEYVTNIVQQSFGMVDRNDATEFVKILVSYPSNGKERLLKAFDEFVDDLVEKQGPTQALVSGSFFMGVLNVNGIISKVELEKMTSSFEQAMLNMVSENT